MYNNFYREDSEKKIFLSCGLPEEQVLKYNITYRLHKLFNSMPRYNIEDLQDIRVSDGIYILFQQEEKYGLIDRIVGVGVNYQDETLKTQLRKELIDGDKNFSPLRFQLGKYILNHCKSLYLRKWENKEYSKSFHKDELEEKIIEEKISVFIKKEISFIYFEVDDKDKKVELRNKIINTLYYDKFFIDSNKISSYYCTSENVRRSGIWNIEEVTKEFLCEEDFTFIEEQCNEIKVLEELKEFNKSSQNKNNRINKKSKKDKEVEYISKFIISKLLQGKKDNKEYLDMVSGDISKELGYSKANIYKVCQAMINMLSKEDIIIHNTPSGKSSILKIRYFIE